MSWGGFLFTSKGAQRALPPNTPDLRTHSLQASVLAVMDELLKDAGRAPERAGRRPRQEGR